MKNEITKVEFADFGLADAILKTVKGLGYETPSPIQAQAIPHILAGSDLVGQAQTGTGKTAAFALPLLSKIDVKEKSPQVLVLTPTRELAIQVAEAFQGYAANLKNFHIIPIYGGQSYTIQLQHLKRGVHVVVGTPGRVMDHMRRGTLRLDSIKALVLDEADEMLRMGFIDDVEWILEKTPDTRQVALFSATMPAPIKKIAQKYLHDPKEVLIKTKTSTVETINQRYWMVSGHHKLDALTRILEAEVFDGILIFVRTKISTVDLSEKLEARGYASAPLNGDIQQRQRERTVNNLKSGKLNIVVATDVAARGLDVDRISHVINFDIPQDIEAYVHRIGRTGRMGKKGEAILFVTPREKRMLFSIEKATRQRIELMKLPTTADINDRRIERFKQRITDTLGTEDLEPYSQIIEQYRIDSDAPSIEIAAALAKLLHGDTPLLLKPQKELRREKPARERSDRDFSDRPRKRRERSEKTFSTPNSGLERYKILVGAEHGVKPGNIVGAIANEAGIDSDYIGRIDIFDTYSTVDLPEGLPRDLMQILSKLVVSGQRLNMSKFDKPKKAFKSGKNFNSDKRKPRAKAKGRKPRSVDKGKPRRKKK